MPFSPCFTVPSQYSRNPLPFLKSCYNSVTVSPSTTKHQFTQNCPKKRYISTLLAAFLCCAFSLFLWRLCVWFDTESTHLTPFVC
uniref:Uncharacterized protein n=1 Tax=Myoviridae sp. ctBCv9 TaxID=2825045 RepID=A0A8S5U6J6_9CAUD|nr:MAG TPA: hypothetical protein [Myoviridae sp. ctBCv9]